MMSGDLRSDLCTESGFHIQVHLEYSRRMRDADMLEKHIIQARLQASATEERAQTEILDEVGEAYHELSLPPGTCYEI